MGVTWVDNDRHSPTPESLELSSRFKALEKPASLPEEATTDPEQVQSVAQETGQLTTKQVVDHMVRIGAADPAGQSIRRRL
jgi:hypothetical protein